MNWNEKEAMRDRLMNNLAEHMIRRGDIITDRQRTNYYCCVRMVELVWRGIRFLITEVDGLTCNIERRS